MINTFTKHIYVALMGAAVLSSCSRPVAYFQRGPVEHYKTPTTENVAVAAPAEVAQPAEAVETASVAVATPAVEPVVQAKQAMNQIEAYVRNDNKLATDKKLNKRMDRVKELLATATTKASMAPVTSTSTKKASLLERVATKKIDKQIKNKLSPERTMAKSILTIGIVIAIIGLILLLLNVVPALAGIALVVGLVMIVLDLLNVV
ncbi:MAG TPA: hypothetical protein VK404_14430 [Spirosoma sp.]|jgi:hypothetical protein|nr:hypothetical protein [Spirosoma sp.]